VELPTALFVHHQSAVKHAIMDSNFLEELAQNCALFLIATLVKQKTLVLNAMQAQLSPKIN